MTTPPEQPRTGLFQTGPPPEPYRWTPTGASKEAEQCPECGAPKWAGEPCMERHLPYYQPLVGPRHKRRHTFRWVFLGLQVGFLLWVITGAISGAATPPSCVGMTGQALQTCRDAAHVGTALGVGLIVFFWAAVDVILGVGWLIFRRRR